MKSKPASDSTFDKTGNFLALCTEIQCFTETNQFNGNKPEPNLTFILNLGDIDETGKDVIFFQGFVTIPLDADGYPKMGGKKSRYYKLLSALYGDRFDPYDPNLDVEIGFPDDYNSVEGILNMPGFKDYVQGEEKLKLKYLKVNGKDIIGQECQIELDYPQKPDGTKSDKIAVTEATPLAKQPVRRSAPPAQQQAPAGMPS